MVLKSLKNKVMNAWLTRIAEKGRGVVDRSADCYSAEAWQKQSEGSALQKN